MNSNGFPSREAVERVRAMYPTGCRVELISMDDPYSSLTPGTKGTVRSVDIAAEMGFSKPSVSVAMKNLREQECITMGEDGLISLTEKGRKIAESVYERHTLFTQWLVSLGVDAATAAQDACRIEHVLSKETFEAIKRHVESGFSSRP